jgi:hypothetical protein
MRWVPDAMWLTYLEVSAPAARIGGDLTVSTAIAAPAWARAASLGR